MAKALVVYATITGNNEDVADIITESFEDQGVEVDETEITMADVEDFKDVDICVVCPYTYDEGALPDEGLDFYDDLQEAKFTELPVQAILSTLTIIVKQSTSLAKRLKKPMRLRVLTMFTSTYHQMKMILKPLIALSQN